MADYVIGVDIGTSTVKSTLHRVDGTLLATAAQPTPVSHPRPGEVERDAQMHWRAIAQVVRQVVADAAIDATDIGALGLAGHGDGLHLVGEDQRLIRPPILSQDTRAAGVIAAWEADGTMAALRRATGQVPFPGSQAPLLRWMSDNAPGDLARARWALTAKDWLRVQLTGEVATDRTDAGGSFADLASHAYSDAALTAAGLTHCRRLLPPVLEPTEIGGRLLPGPATELGLPAGLPVTAGLHDVAATILGSVGAHQGRLCVISGTFGVNVVLVTAPVQDPMLNTRPGPLPQTWTVRRTARASGASIQWAAHAILGPHGTAREVLDLAFEREPQHPPPIFIPYVFGGTHGQPDDGAFLELHGWHDRAALLQGVVECVAFNHVNDVGVLRERVPIQALHLAGGLTRDARWNQLMADALGEAVTCTPSEDTGARGAAATALVAIGAAGTLHDAAERLRAPSQRVEPGAAAHRRQDDLARYRAALAADHPSDPGQREQRPEKTEVENS